MGSAAPSQPGLRGDNVGSTLPVPEFVFGQIPSLRPRMRSVIPISKWENKAVMQESPSVLR